MPLCVSWVTSKYELTFAMNIGPTPVLVFLSGLLCIVHVASGTLSLLLIPYYYCLHIAYVCRLLSIPGCTVETDNLRM